MVAHDASRAASAAGLPSRAAICDTAPGTYTDPAHSPIIAISRNNAFSSVRRR